MRSGAARAAAVSALLICAACGGSPASLAARAPLPSAADGSTAGIGPGLPPVPGAGVASGTGGGSVALPPPPGNGVTPGSGVSGSAEAGSGSTGPGNTTSVTPPTPPTPQPAQPGVLTEQSSGQTIRLIVGQSVHVQLPGGSSGGYHQPISSSAAMHRDSAAGGYPSSEPATAQFTAAAAGSADLTSMTDFTCLHTSPSCLPPQREWVVHVIVTG